MVAGDQTRRRKPKRRCSRLAFLGASLSSAGIALGVAWNFTFVEGNPNNYWDGNTNWSYVCPPPVDPCPGGLYPSEDYHNALITGDTSGGEGNLTVSLIDETILGLKITPDDPNDTLKVDLESKDSGGNTITRSRFILDARSGNLEVRVIDNAEVLTN